MEASIASEPKGAPMSNVASARSTPSSRLSYAALAFAVGAVVAWGLAGMVNQDLYSVTGALGIVAFGLGVKGRRLARSAGESGRLALAATVVGGLLGGAVIAALVGWGISALV